MLGTLTTLLSFAFVLGVLVFVHELGHFLAAKRVGIKVLKFQLGFNPTILSFRRGDTEYGIGALPLGGYVRITGRIKEIIIRNAENISAPEVENALTSHPKIAEAAVIGLPDPRTGERCCAVVALKPGVTSLTLAEVFDHCMSLQLAKYKVPEQLEIVGRQRLRLVGGREMLVGLPPCPASVGLAAELDIDCRRHACER